MFGLSYIRLAVFALAALAILTVVGGFWLHYQNLQSNLAEVSAELATAQAVITAKNAAIAERDFIINEMEERKADMQQKLVELEQAEDDANRRWFDALADLAELTAQDPDNPGLPNEAANRLRDRNRAVNRMLEQATGR